MHLDAAVEPIATGFNSPEGPAFHLNGELYFVNWLTSSINQLGADGVVREFVNTGGIPAGLAFHPDGSLYCADEGDRIHGVIKISPSGQISTFVDNYAGRPLNGANDLVFDNTGVLYFSDPWGSSWDHPTGGFYRVFPDGRLEQIDTGLGFPNGVAVSADGATAFLAETNRNQVLRYDADARGQVEPVVFARLAGGHGPDGMALAADGHLLVAHYGGGQVVVFDPNGRQVGAIPIPGKGVTNVAFGGPAYDEIVVTDVETASVYRIKIGLKGQKLYGGLR